MKQSSLSHFNLGPNSSSHHFHKEKSSSENDDHLGPQTLATINLNDLEKLNSISRIEEALEENVSNMQLSIGSPKRNLQTSRQPSKFGGEVVRRDIEIKIVE